MMRTNSSKHAALARSRAQSASRSHSLVIWSCALAALLVMAGVVTPAEAQRVRPRQPAQPQQPAQPAPSAPASADPADAAPADEAAAEQQADKTPEPVLEPSPYITRTNVKPWTFRAEVLITAYQDAPRSPQDTRELTIVPMDFTSATVLFPIVPETSSASVRMKETESGEVPAIEGQVRVNDQPVPQDLAFINRGLDGELLPGGTWRAQWLVARPDQSGFRNVRQVDLQLEVPVEAAEVRFDEAAASEVEWPKGPWPEAARAALVDEPFIEYEPGRTNRAYRTSEMDALLDKWLEGNDPRSLKPVVLAKWIAGNVSESIQPSGNGLVFDGRRTLMAGFELQAPETTAQNGRGSPFDMTNLLVAMYRRVGLPARVVIGYDVNAANDGKTFYDDADGDAEIRSWVEFCLYDEANGTLGWVPVDVVAMRERSSRMPPRYLERPARYFGSHPDLDEVIPIAFQYVPAKTSAVYYNAPSLWGWFVQPQAPVAGAQTLRFDASRTAVRGGSRRR